MNKALLIVDMQNDFVLPNGKLYVSNAETLIEPIKSKIKKEMINDSKIIGSRDWHDKDNVSFEKWGEHCIKNTWGSEFVYDANKLDLLISKGIEIDSDSYSAFYISYDKKSELHEYLINNKIDEIEIIGVAREICVEATYLDAKKFGFNAWINEELTKKINND